jgi:hypothetical protein
MENPKMEPRIWYPIIEQIRPGPEQASPFWSGCNTVYRIGFYLEHDGVFLLPVPEWSSHQYRYRCSDCHLDCGTDEDGFVTDWACAKDIKDGPTETQLDQIRKHTKQHQIMLAWARSLK